MDYIRWLRSHVGHERVILTFVGGCVYNAQGEVLLQRRGDNGRWGLPGGAIEPGESIRQAAARELLEETGLVVDVKRLIGLYTDPDMVYPNGDKAHSICIAVEFTVLGGELRCDAEESLELRYFPMDALPELFCQQHQRILRDAHEGRQAAIE